jgi:hypothetical protein
MDRQMLTRDFETVFAPGECGKKFSAFFFRQTPTRPNDKQKKKKNNGGR